MLTGYARVSTEDQNLDPQCDALTAVVPARGLRAHLRRQSMGVRDDRPGLTEALSHLRQGDCLVIWRLDRLGAG